MDSNDTPSDPRVKGTSISDGTVSTEAFFDQVQQIGSVVEAKVSR